MIWRQPDLFTKRVRKPPLAKERETQISLMDLLIKYRGLAPGWTAFHIPNGELRNPETGALLQRMGTMAGVLDLEFISPIGRPYFLELKRGGAPLTEAQEAFMARMAASTVECAVGRSFAEAVECLKAWGACRAEVQI